MTSVVLHDVLLHDVPLWFLFWLLGVLCGTGYPIISELFGQSTTGRNMCKAYERLLKLKEQLKDYDNLNIPNHAVVKVYVNSDRFCLVWWGADNEHQNLSVDFKDDTDKIFNIKSTLDSVGCYELISKIELQLKKDIDDANDLCTMLAAK